MRFAYALFARCAELMADRSVGVIGGCFEVLRLSGFPAVTPGIAVVARVRCSADEFGREFTLSMRILGPNNEVVAEQPSLPFTPIDEQGAGGVTAILSMFGLVFPTVGDYRFVFSVDGKEVGSETLRVRGLEPSA